MAAARLSPSLNQLAQEYVLVQAWKKAHEYIRRHNWYADVLELDLTNADLETALSTIASELDQDLLKASPLRLVLAPKSQTWAIQNNQWQPTEIRAAGPRLRPLSHLPVRDQVLATAFMMLFADTVESRQGDPRKPAMSARRDGMVSYGHRLFCDNEAGQLRFRWGSAFTYRQYFQDYQAFVTRPAEIVQNVFKTDTDWAILYADVSQFYDRIRPAILHQKVSSILGGLIDNDLLQQFKSFFNWQWHPDDQDEAGAYALRSDPVIPNFENIALPQGLVASGFFANVTMIEFDEAVCNRFDKWNDDQWQTIDYCRYVDDIRIVVRLGEKLQNAKEQDILQILTSYFDTLIAQHIEGLSLNKSKCSLILGRNAAAGSIRVSDTMRRIDHNTSGTIDLITGEETIDLIEGLVFSQQDEPLVFQDKFTDTFFAAKPDVRDDTVARFSANRFRRTYRLLRPMCETAPTTSDKSFQPSISREMLDNRAMHFSRRLIERWVRDPSNMRLLRVALDVCPDPKALDVVLYLLRKHMKVRRLRPTSINRVSWYCAAEVLKAGATETGLVRDIDALPQTINLRRYQEVLADFAQELLNDGDRLPWYVQQQAHLFLACIRRPFDGSTQLQSQPLVENYLQLRRIMDGRQTDLEGLNLVRFVLLQRRLQGVADAARTFLDGFRAAVRQVRQGMLLRILHEDFSLSERVREKMTEAERAKWEPLFYAYGVTPSIGFPNSVESLPASRTAYPLLAVCRSALNPFQQEYAALHFALALLQPLGESPSLLCPAWIKIDALNWRMLWRDSFPIDEGAVAVEVDATSPSDNRFAVPRWVTRRNRWQYQLGQILRVLLTGMPDFTVTAPSKRYISSHVLYKPYSSSWMRRRYGMFSGRSALGPPWLPISSWLSSLIARLLEWPGCSRFEFDFSLADDFDISDLTVLLQSRLSDLERYYGRASRTPILPMPIPKAFMRPTKRRANSREATLNAVRVGVVQTVIPRKTDFLNDVEQNNVDARRRHRRHLSAVLAGVHRMLQVRETHCNTDFGVELLVLPELSIHLDDLRTHVIPFVLQHRCMVFAGMVFHSMVPGGPLINSAFWLIPVTRPDRGLQVEIIEQGKYNLTQDEINQNIVRFRPAQWILDFVHPAVGTTIWSMSGSICYDATDLCLAADLRDLTHMYVVSALNKDVGTFDNMVAALHYHMFQHVIVANTGEFGGSTGQAPFSDRNKRTIFHTHGNEQVAISFFEVDVATYRPGGAGLKTPPAGHNRLV